MKKLFLFVAGCVCIMACNNKTSDQTTAKDSTATAEPKPLPQTEFADQKYTDIGKKGNAQMESGDVDGWLTQFSDNAHYNWSGGDSLVGKAAIAAYWKNRRAKVIDSIKFSYDIWLPIKVNTPQKGPDRAGIWLLGWSQVNVKYKNGKKLTFWHHTDYHFDNNDKVDLVVQYLDRAPINAALKK
ncbi:MAG TPA: nuclear transport factor 2 family protein [Puia sp.]|nr:nuclear transport factor 2 family protein [Puia sp.]